MLDISTVPNIKEFPPGNEQNRCSGKPWRKFRSFQLRVFLVRNRKIGVGNLVFNSKFSVLGMVRNGKLGVGKPLSLINLLQKTPRFSTPGFGYSAKWETPSGKTGSLRFPSRPRRFDSDTCCELEKPKESRLLKCLIRASRKSGKEKREKFLVIGATRCATKFKIDIYEHEIKRILTPNSELS